MKPEDLHQYLTCDPERGVLTWKPRGLKGWDRRYSGRTVGSPDSRGYCGFNLAGNHLRVHRVIWAMTHGYWPHMVDHINGNPTDNRIANLREVTRTENQRNAKLYATNKSGYPGVFYWEKRRKWRVHIGKRGYIGVYPTYEEAVAARVAAERDEAYHNNHGRAQ